MTDNKIYISWEDFHKDAKGLATLLKEQNHFNKVIAISRGGLIPAGIVTYELDIRNCETVNMSSYDDNYIRRDDTDIELSAKIADVDEHTIFIDDLSDSGRTFQILRQLFPKAKFASVYAKPQGQKYADIFYKEVPDDWIVFPWDL